MIRVLHTPAKRRRSRIVSVEDLTAYGLVAADARRHCPLAVEYVALDGQPCRLLGDLRPLLADLTGRDRP